MQNVRIYWLLMLALLLLFPGALLPAAEPLEEIAIPAPQAWRKERFSLPPSFAPAMKFKGMEELRFAPGMFRPEAADFFTYVLVFRLTDQPALDQDTLNTELLAYYRGLAAAVSGGKVDPSGFTLKTEAQPAAENFQEYRATLVWTEPFATRKKQTLHFRIRVWRATQNRSAWVFLAASPQSKEAPLWKTLDAIGDQFFQNNSPSPGIVPK